MNPVHLKQCKDLQMEFIKYQERANLVVKTFDNYITTVVEVERKKWILENSQAVKDGTSCRQTRARTELRKKTKQIFFGGADASSFLSNSIENSTRSSKTSRSLLMRTSKHENSGIKSEKGEVSRSSLAAIDENTGTQKTSTEDVAENDEKEDSLDLKVEAEDFTSFGCEDQNFEDNKSSFVGKSITADECKVLKKEADILQPKVVLHRLSDQQIKELCSSKPTEPASKPSLGTKRNSRFNARVRFASYIFEPTYKSPRVKNDVKNKKGILKVYYNQSKIPIAPNLRKLGLKKVRPPKQTETKIVVSDQKPEDVVEKRKSTLRARSKSMIVESVEPRGQRTRSKAKKYSVNQVV